MIKPSYLQAGDKIGVISTSNFTEESYINQLLDILKSWQLEPVLGKTIGPRAGSFAGPDELRKNDLQEMLDNDAIKAILQTTGGYGIFRIIDQVSFRNYKYKPKWIVGYSDTTFLHSHLQGSLGTASIQATMAADLEAGYEEASWESLRKALFGEELSYTIKTHPLNRAGVAEGILVGGTASILCNAKGTFSEVNTNGNILFLEEVGEKHFRLDSYIMSLKKAGKFKYLKGLIIGHLTDILEDEPPFGMTPEEIIHNAVKELDFPVCFGFPAGHSSPNLALKFGIPVRLQVTTSGSTIRFME
ncbi:S66 peptidase family protein [Adhaeribacter aquaticus]|uniref:S66 peptidase family protein n=1 Tax=Adhaeribacter aquaticus TaxID=299567 RepID=UPI000411F2B0|nr:LD-carboxypeptidase [Adhaeribacter aquaticus]